MTITLTEQEVYQALANYLGKELGLDQGSVMVGARWYGFETDRTRVGQGKVELDVEKRGDAE